MSFKKIDAQDIDYFRTVLTDNGLRLSETERRAYSSDHTEDLSYLPEIVLLPDTPEQVSQILRYCHTHRISVSPRGAGTGLSGGSLPVYGGVSLSGERFSRVLEIDEANFQATVEPGVINQVFQDAVAEKGLFYPPDPASKGSCFLGGNVAHSSGGPRALKYGTTKDYVLNLEVVLPTGEIIWTGANTLKYSTGYHLTQLMVGSEGTLGFITKIVLKLLPLPKQNLLMLAAFSEPEKACAAVAEIFRAGITPSALEFMERDAIEYSMTYSNIHFDLAGWVKAHLLIEVDGNAMDELYGECEKINAVLEEFDCGEVLFAESSEEKNRLWSLRRKVGEAVKSHSVYKEEDTVVPRAYLPQLLEGVKEVGARYGFRSVCYGHAGDGNLHVNILRGELDDQAWNVTLKEGIREIFTLCKKLGGTLSGEHGIGLVQKEYMDIVFPEVQLELMRGIKRAFDPNGIMNPGKIF